MWGLGFELDEEERKKIKEINLKTQADSLITKIKRTEVLREAARKRGIIADKLDDLKSETGEPFAESESVNSRFLLPRKIKMAVVSGKTNPSSKEVAYLCRYVDYHVIREVMRARGLKKDPLSCGWVKGLPKQEDHDEIGPLSGSMGWKYTCRICGQELERIEFMKS